MRFKVMAMESRIVLDAEIAESLWAVNDGELQYGNDQVGEDEDIALEGFSLTTTEYLIDGVGMNTFWNTDFSLPYTFRFVPADADTEGDDYGGWTGPSGSIIDIGDTEGDSDEWWGETAYIARPSFSYLSDYAQENWLTPLQTDALAAGAVSLGDIDNTQSLDAPTIIQGKLFTDSLISYLSAMDDPLVRIPINAQYWLNGGLSIKQLSGYAGAGATVLPSEDYPGGGLEISTWGSSAYTLGENTIVMNDADGESDVPYMVARYSAEEYQKLIVDLMMYIDQELSDNPPTFIIDLHWNFDRFGDTQSDAGGGYYNKIFEVFDSESNYYGDLNADNIGIWASNDADPVSGNVSSYYARQLFGPIDEDSLGNTTGSAVDFWESVTAMFGVDETGALISGEVDSDKNVYAEITDVDLAANVFFEIYNEPFFSKPGTIPANESEVPNSGSAEFIGPGNEEITYEQASSDQSDSGWIETWIGNYINGVSSTVDGSSIAGMLPVIQSIRDSGAQNVIIANAGGNYAYEADITAASDTTVQLSNSLEQLINALDDDYDTNIILGAHPYMGPWQAADPSKNAANFYDWLTIGGESSIFSDYPFIATEFGQYQGLGATYGSGATDYEWYQYDGVSPVSGEPTSYNAAILDIIQDLGASVAAWGNRPATYGVYEGGDLVRTASYIQDGEVYLDETTLLEAANQPDTTVLMSILDDDGDVESYSVELIAPDFDSGGGGGGGGGGSWEDYKDSTSFDIQLDLSDLSAEGDVTFAGIPVFDTDGSRITLENGKTYSSASSYNFQVGDSITATFNLSQMNPLYSASFYVIAPASLDTYEDASNSATPELEFMVSNSNLAFRSGAHYSEAGDEDLIGVAAYTLLDKQAAGVQPENNDDDMNTIWGEDLQVYNVTVNSNGDPVTESPGAQWYTFDMAYLFGNYADVSTGFDPGEDFDLLVEFTDAEDGAEGHIAFTVTLKQGDISEQIYPPSELFSYDSASGQTWMAELDSTYKPVAELSSDAYDQSYRSDGLGSGWVVMASLLDPDDSGAGYDVPPYSYDGSNLIVNKEGLEVVYELANGYYDSSASEEPTDVLGDSAYKTSGMNFEYLYDTYFSNTNASELSLPEYSVTMYTYLQNTEVQSARAFAGSLYVKSLENANTIQQTDSGELLSSQNLLGRVIENTSAIYEAQAKIENTVVQTSLGVDLILEKARVQNLVNLSNIIGINDDSLDQVPALITKFLESDNQRLTFEQALEDGSFETTLDAALDNGSVFEVLKTTFSSLLGIELAESLWAVNDGALVYGNDQVGEDEDIALEGFSLTTTEYLIDGVGMNTFWNTDFSLPYTFRFVPADADTEGDDYGGWTGPSGSIIDIGDTEGDSDEWWGETAYIARPSFSYLSDYAQENWLTPLQTDALAAGAVSLGDIDNTQSLDAPTIIQGKLFTDSLISYLSAMDDPLVRIPINAQYWLNGGLSIKQLSGYAGAGATVLPSEDYPGGGLEISTWGSSAYTLGENTIVMNDADGESDVPYMVARYSAEEYQKLIVDLMMYIDQELSDNPPTFIIDLHWNFDRFGDTQSDAGGGYYNKIFEVFDSESNYYGDLNADNIGIWASNDADPVSGNVSSYYARQLFGPIDEDSLGNTTGSAVDFWESVTAMFGVDETGALISGEVDSDKNVYAEITDVDLAANVFFEIYNEPFFSKPGTIPANESEVPNSGSAEFIGPGNEEITYEQASSDQSDSGWIETWIGNYINGVSSTVDGSSIAGMLPVIQSIRDSGAQNVIIANAGGNYAYEADITAASDTTVQLSNSLEQLINALDDDYDTNIILGAHPYMGPWQAADPSKNAANFYDWLTIGGESSIFSDYPFIATEFGQYQGLGATYGSGATDYEWYQYDGVSPVSGEPTSYNAAILDIIQDLGASVAAWGNRPATYGVYEGGDLVRTASYIQDGEVYLDETTLLEAANQPDTTVLMSILDDDGDVESYSVELIAPDFDSGGGGGGGGGGSWEDYKDSTSFDIQLDLSDLSAEGDVAFAGIPVFDTDGSRITLENGKTYSSASSYNFQVGDSITATFNLSQMNPLYSASFYVIAPASLDTYEDASNSATPELEFMVSNSNLAFRSGAHYSEAGDEDLIGVAAYTLLDKQAAGVQPENNDDDMNTIWGEDLQVYNVTVNSNGDPVTESPGAQWYTFDMAYLFGNYADVSTGFDPGEDFDLLVEFTDAEDGAEGHIAFTVTLKQGDISEQIYPPSELFSYDSASGQTWMAELDSTYKPVAELSSDAYDQSYRSDGLGSGWVVMTSLLDPDDSGAGYDVPPYSYDGSNLIVNKEGLEVVYELANGYYDSSASEEPTDVLGDSAYKTSGMNFEYLYDTYFSNTNASELSLPEYSVTMYTYLQNTEVQSARAFAGSLYVKSLENANTIQQTDSGELLSSQNLLGRVIENTSAIYEAQAKIENTVVQASLGVDLILEKARVQNLENLIRIVSSFNEANLQQVQAMTVELFNQETLNALSDASLESSELRRVLNDFVGTLQQLVQEAYGPGDEVSYSQDIVGYIQNLQQVFEDVALDGDVTGSIDLETFDINNELSRNKILTVRVLESFSSGFAYSGLLYSGFDSYVSLAEFNTIDFGTDSSSAAVSNASFELEEEVFNQAGSVLSTTILAKDVPIVSTPKSKGDSPIKNSTMQNSKAHAMNKGFTHNLSHGKLQELSLSQSEKVVEADAKLLEEKREIEGAPPEQAEQAEQAKQAKQAEPAEPAETKPAEAEGTQ